MIILTEEQIKTAMLQISSAIDASVAVKKETQKREAERRRAWEAKWDDDVHPIRQLLQAFCKGYACQLTESVRDSPDEKTLRVTPPFDNPATLYVCCSRSLASNQLNANLVLLACDGQSLSVFRGYSIERVMAELPDFLVALWMHNNPSLLS